MKYAVLVALLLGHASALAAPPLVRVSTAPPDGAPVDVAHATAPRASLEVTAGEATTAEDVAIEGKGKGTLREKVSELFTKHYRVSFALIRGIANTSVVTWGLILSSHVALAAALPVGLIAGGMSAGLQYFNQSYTKWMMRSKTLPGQLGRNYVTNVVYMTITKFVSAAAQVPQEHSLALAATTVLKASFLGTLAQGTWSLAFAKNAKLQIEQNPAKEARIHRMTDFKAVVNSMVSTAISVASLMGAPMTDAAMLGMAATGAVYYGWVALKARRWAKKSEGALLACEANLAH